MTAQPEMAITIQPYLNGSLSPSLVLLLVEGSFQLLPISEVKSQLNLMFPFICKVILYYAITFQTKTAFRFAQEQLQQMKTSLSMH